MTRFIIFLLLIPIKIFGQDIKVEAISTFKDIIKCYYEKDCIKFYSYWSDSISVLNIGSNNKESFSTQITQNGNNNDCVMFDRIIEKTKNYDNYLLNYEIKAVTYDEFKFTERKELLKEWDSIKKTNGIWILAYITIYNEYFHSKDVLVIGDIPKDTNDVLGEQFIYMLRKINDQWKIIGVIN